MPFLAGQRAWNHGKTKENDPRVRKISETFKTRHIDNFARWRLKERLAGRIPATHIPLEKTGRLAFLVGMTLGDGHIEKFPRSERLHIVLGTDKPLLWRHVAKAVEQVFSKKLWVRRSKQGNYMEISLYQTRLSKRLEVPAGSRGKLKVRLPEWIRSERRYLSACLKGLFEAEGFYSVHEPTYTYNLGFSNRNLTLLNEVEWALTLLGFHPERRSYAVRLRKKQEAARFIELIRFRSYNS